MDGISVKPIYRHFLNYQLLVSVKFRSDEISVNLGGFLANISVKHLYQRCIGIF